MNRRIPRRRISPRTVRRYRAIKNFVRRALGSSSQPDIRTNSSISVSVLDLRQKIDGIEQQLNTVSKHCQDLATLQSRSELNNNINSQKDTDKDTAKFKESKINILPQTSQHRYDNRSTPKVSNCDNEAEIKVIALNKMLNQNYSTKSKESRKSKLYHRLDSIEENEQRLDRHKKHMASRILPTNLTMHNSHSFNEYKTYTRHLDVDSSDVHRQRNRKKTEYYDTNDGLIQLNNNKEPTYGNYKNHRNNKYVRSDVDQDFIADIIRRQYRPVKLFGRRESDFSQFSAPVCRDPEFPITETIQEGSDLCSCCHKEHRSHRHSKYMHSNNLSDMRSICDTRLYSSKKHKYITNHRKHENYYYNDSAIYDIIPVKEKSSPKSRKKFMEDNMLMHDNYKEVPPSPRTNRPRLNLQAQFQIEDDEDVIPLEKQMKRLQRKSLTQNEGNYSNISSQLFIHNRNFKCMQNLDLSKNPEPYNEECVGTKSTSQYPILHDQAIINNDTTLNTQTTDVSGGKTDKTLSEIKCILQNFLQEIKKESSQNEKLSGSLRSALENINDKSQQIKVNSFHNNNNFSQSGLSPFMQSFPNCCCYPILPVCPINCVQNGFVLPSPSFTCAACANNSKERTCESNDLKNKSNSSEDASSETQKLLKEIHNLILRNPNSIQKKEICNDNKPVSSNKSEEPKTHTIKSTCGNSKVSKHDAKVGTTKLKYYSKSCEAIGSREATDTRHATIVSYSDTVLEKGSGEEITTGSASESEYSSETTVMDKKKGNKFKKILRSIGILKKNKSDVIEELSESDSTMDTVNTKPRSNFQSNPTRSPYQQHFINYNMHGQEYFHPPVAHQHPRQYEYRDHHDPRPYYTPANKDNKINFNGRQYPEQRIAHGLSCCASPKYSPIPMCTKYYDPHYGNVSPPIPVCLKEIEVKSIGTQSARKISLLQKLTNKIQVQQTKESSPKQSFTRTSSRDKNSKDKPEPMLFDWKKIHEKAMQKTTDPLKFSFKTQKRIAEEDNTMRNAMLKKLFYKRNPFSPSNLLVRTLLGKDKSSFGEPPKMYKPRMFL